MVKVQLPFAIWDVCVSLESLRPELWTREDLEQRVGPFVDMPRGTSAWIRSIVFIPNTHTHYYIWSDSDVLWTTVALINGKPIHNMLIMLDFTPRLRHESTIWPYHMVAKFNIKCLVVKQRNCRFYIGPIQSWLATDGRPQCCVMSIPYTLDKLAVDIRNCRYARILHK